MTNNILTSEQINRVKSLGCLIDKRYGNVFNVRVITRNGKITTDEQRAIAEAADLFGSSEVAMTTRQTIEIQGVPYENIDKLISFLSDHGLETGGTGPKVRPIVSCKGTTCRFGLIDTYALSMQIHERFYVGYHNTALPHKFKIAVGGCPNNCVKPDINDLGVIGQRIKNLDTDKCRACKKCIVESECPMKAVSVKDSKVCVNINTCNNCGRCFEKCSFGVFSESSPGYKISIGGRWGKKTSTGKFLSKIFTDQEEVLNTIEKAIIFYRDEGIKGERFAETIERLGFEYVEKKLISD